MTCQGSGDSYSPVTKGTVITFGRSDEALDFVLGASRAHFQNLWQKLGIERSYSIIQVRLDRPHEPCTRAGSLHALVNFYFPNLGKKNSPLHASYMLLYTVHGDGLNALVLHYKTFLYPVFARDSENELDLEAPKTKSRASSERPNVA